MGYCVGQIKGDPDIAGIGVVVSFFVTTGITILLSTALWFHVVIRKGDLEPSHKANIPSWVQVLQRVLVMLGDTQLVTGLAVMIASSVNILTDEDTPLYHIFVARSLADVALVGHAAAVIQVYPTEHNWAARLFLVTVAVALWQWWTMVAIERFRLFEENNYANNLTPVCFENHNIFGLDYTTWMYISLAWVPIGYSTLYLALWSRGRKFTDKFEELITGWPVNIGQHLTKLKDAGEKFSSARDLIAMVVRAVLLAISSTSLLVFWAFAILFPASRTLSPIQNLVSFAWDIYDVYTVRKANANIVVVNPAYRIGKSFQNNDNPENDWGFGQILPFVMLLLPLLSGMDYISDVQEEKHHTH